MKRLFVYLIATATAVGTGCDNNDINVFDKPAAVRAQEAIDNLRAELTAPDYGWKVKYKPEDGSGSFYVLMDFDDDYKVTIRTDLGADDGKYFLQTISYRIDNSLGLELILETYSFFHYLYELDQASFGAEFEFNYVNKTPDGELVFNSKSDLSNKTILTFEPAAPADLALLGTTVSENLNTMGEDLDMISSSYQIVYQDKDLILYASMDPKKRVITISSSTKKTDTQTSDVFAFTSGYVIKGDSIVFDSRLSGTFSGQAININGLKLNTLTESSINVCVDPTTVHQYAGVTSQGDAISLETSLVSATGATFADVSDFYFSPINYILDHGVSAASQITQDISGALEMDLYYGIQLNDGSHLYGIGFVIQNLDGTYTLAVREFTPVLVNNNIVFNFQPGFRLFGNQTTDANLDNINIYLDKLTAGNTTYVFKYADNVYEFNNPCTGWSFVFVNANN